MDCTATLNRIQTSLTPQQKFQKPILIASGVVFTVAAIAFVAIGAYIKAAVALVGVGICLLLNRKIVVEIPEVIFISVPAVNRAVVPARRVNDPAIALRLTVPREQVTETEVVAVIVIEPLANETIKSPRLKV